MPSMPHAKALIKHLAINALVKQRGLPRIDAECMIYQSEHILGISLTIADCRSVHVKAFDKSPYGVQPVQLDCKSAPILATSTTTLPNSPHATSSLCIVLMTTLVCTETRCWRYVQTLKMVDPRNTVLCACVYRTSV